nr:hypothetical protein Q903MT_gene2748 [Picea sitchensis]
MDYQTPGPGSQVLDLYQDSNGHACVLFILMGLFTAGISVPGESPPELPLGKC